MPSDKEISAAMVAAMLAHPKSCTIHRKMIKAALEAAEKARLEERPQPIIYRHHKGGLYEYLDHVRRESDLEVLVLYRSIGDGLSYVRPETEFNKKFKREEILPVPPKEEG